MRAICRLALLYCATLAPSHAASLIKDGGFERPSVPPGYYTVYDPGAAIGPWTVVGAGSIFAVSTSFSFTGIVFDAHAGQVSLDLGATGGAGQGANSPGVAQTFRTTPGAAYLITLWVGNIYQPPGQGLLGTTSTVNVYNGTTLLLSATNASKKGTTQQVWKKFTTTFTATSRRTTLSFIDGDPSNDWHCGLDSVTVKPASPNS